MRVLSVLTQFGFDVPRLGFGLRTALASCLALLLAWLMGLEHPQWSAMTVWAVSQPVRGMLVEKSAFRALGTLIGTLFGVLLVLVAGDNLPLMVICLSLWIGLCVGLGNLLSGLMSYCTLLSGYSATMVALLNTQQPAGQIFLLGSDRLLTVLSGVMVGLLVGLIFTPRGAEDELSGRVRRGTSDILRAMAARFAAAQMPSREDTAHQLLKEIAVTEESFDVNAAGSLRSHRSVRALRALVQAQVAATYWIRTSRNLPPDEPIAEALIQVAQALEASAPARQVLAALERVLARSPDQQTTEVIRQLHDSLREHLASREQHQGIAIIRNRVVLHRDWIGARQAALRATGLLLLIGAAWVATGWSAGAYVMLGVSVMITLFSTFETPAKIMGHIFFWQMLGAIAALCCHWLVWPLVSTEWQLIATLIPFILAFVPFFAHPRFNLGSMDYVMVLLLLSHPAYPLSNSFNESLTMALAVVAGPLLAYITFRLVWPADAQRRRQHLTRMMLNELRGMAASPLVPARHAIWRARLYHRLLKLIQSVNRSAQPLQPVASGGLAVLATGEAIQRLHELRDAPPTPRIQQRVEVTLQRLQRLNSKPEAAARNLRRLADQLNQHDHTAAWELDNAARAIAANTAFFVGTPISAQPAPLTSG